MNINKFLSSCGYTSRRKADLLVTAKKVMVNGKVAILGQKVDPRKDKVSVDNQVISQSPKKVYLMLNKPKGIISTLSDEKGRKTVLDLVDIKERVYPVGRLDSDSEGLIILTNDGELAQNLTHPKFEVRKTYSVLVSGQVNKSKMERLTSGIKLKEGIARADKVSEVKKEGRFTWLEITLHEGKNREVRRMLGSLDLEVVALKRISLGSLNLENLPSGQSRLLTTEEVNELKTLHS